ncbi:hypothetical protein TIFTF001_055380 [Ficus carica]|uniref:Uncharacterized protein n=1 Tax=Ficus carica TaxID=3494 RepID=A0AA88EFN1_FICCA|nr:hypothetical protein TIFTF001_055380 [Ficus carica]
MGRYELDTTARSSLDLDFTNIDPPGDVVRIEYNVVGREEKVRS